MAEHIRISRVSHAGIAHVEEFSGDSLVAALNGTTVVIRRVVAEELASVHSRSRVDCIDWYPSKPKENT